jgi:hypothetical protein
MVGLSAMAVSTRSASASRSSPRPPPLLLVPACSGSEFRVGLVENDDVHLRFARRRVAMRARTTSQGSNFAVPRSTSSNLRSTSASQAASTYSSAGSSRLAMRTFATSARSSGGSCRACASTAFLDMSGSWQISGRLHGRRRDGAARPSSVDSATKRRLYINRLPASRARRGGLSRLANAMALCRGRAAAVAHQRPVGPPWLSGSRAFGAESARAVHQDSNRYRPRGSPWPRRADSQAPSRCELLLR